MKSKYFYYSGAVRRSNSIHERSFFLRFFISYILLMILYRKIWFIDMFKRISSLWCRLWIHGRRSRCRASIRASFCWNISGIANQQQCQILQLRQPSCRWGRQFWNRQRKRFAKPQCTVERMRSRQGKLELIGLK